MFSIHDWKISEGVLYYTREHGVNIVSGKFIPVKGNIRSLVYSQKISGLEVVGLETTKIGLRVNIVLENGQKIAGNTKEICKK